jgi:hypothetical protein
VKSLEEIEYRMIGLIENILKYYRLSKLNELDSFSKNALIKYQTIMDIEIELYKKALENE